MDGKKLVISSIHQKENMEWGAKKCSLLPMQNPVVVKVCDGMKKLFHQTFHLGGKKDLKQKKIIPEMKLDYKIFI